MKFDEDNQKTNMLNQKEYPPGNLLIGLQDTQLENEITSGFLKL